MKKDSLYKKILEKSKKIKAIKLFGGKCRICGDNNISHLVFHHRDKNTKRSKICSLMSSSWRIIEKELKKCDLLCHNCHEELHEKERIISYNDKKIYMEYKGITGCEMCGYNKCDSALQFHHENEDEKIFAISKLKKKDITSIEEIRKDIINELNKCIVLCANCHNEYHTDMNFFDEYHDEIYEKLNNLKEFNPRIDKKIVEKLYFEDKLKQCEIVIKLNSKSSTIHNIIRKLKMSRSENLVSS